MRSLRITPVRPKAEIDPVLIEQWASEGLTRRQMAAKIGIRYDTFCRRMSGSDSLTKAFLRGQLKINE